MYTHIYIYIYVHTYTYLYISLYTYIYRERDIFIHMVLACRLCRLAMLLRFMCLMETLNVVQTTLVVKLCVCVCMFHVRARLPFQQPTFRKVTT